MCRYIYIYKAVALRELRSCTEKQSYEGMFNIMSCSLLLKKKSLYKYSILREIVFFSLLHCSDIAPGGMVLKQEGIGLVLLAHCLPGILYSWSALVFI